MKPSQYHIPHNLDGDVTITNDSLIIGECVIHDSNHLADDIGYVSDIDTRSRTSSISSIQSSGRGSLQSDQMLWSLPEDTMYLSLCETRHAIGLKSLPTNLDSSYDDSLDDESIELESRYYSISEEEIRTPTDVGQDADLNKTQESIRSDMTAFMEDELCFSTIRNKAFKERRPSLLKRIKNYTKNRALS